MKNYTATLIKHSAKFLVVAYALIGLGGCATIVNDPNVPLVFTFSDGSAGHCNFKNKRGFWETDIPTTGVMIRRSDDALIYDCVTKDGREVTGSVRSEMEGGKLAASVFFWDFGITDAITDKHRTYQGNVVIPVPPIENDSGQVSRRTGQTGQVDANGNDAEGVEGVEAGNETKKSEDGDGLEVGGSSQGAA